MTALRRSVPEPDHLWRVEQASDCEDDYLIISLDSSKPVVRIEPYDPKHPVREITLRYAEVICALMNKSEKLHRKLNKKGKKK